MIWSLPQHLQLPVHRSYYLQPDAELRLHHRFRLSKYPAIPISIRKRTTGSISTVVHSLMEAPSDKWEKHFLNMFWKLPPDVLSKPKKPVFTIWPFLNRVLLCNRMSIKFQKGLFYYETVKLSNLTGFKL